MSATERKKRTRWPGIQFLRRRDNRRYRMLTRKLLRQGKVDEVVPPKATSAKWEVW